jgi:hypothetical protein
MADDEEALTQLSSGNYGADFLGAKLRGVVRARQPLSPIPDKSIAATRKSRVKYGAM